MTFKMIRPMAITDAVVISSNVGENEYAAYNSGTAYTQGERVQVITPLYSRHKVYEALQASTNKRAEIYSASSLQISSTVKSLAVINGAGYTAGQVVRLAAMEKDNHYMDGTVASYAVAVLSAGVSAAAFPSGAAYNTATGEMWVCNSDANTVQRFDAFGASQGTTSTGASTRPLVAAYNSVTGEMWVCNQSSATVQRFNASGGSLGVTATGSSPNAIAYNSGTGEMWVCNYNSGTVQRYSSTGASLGTAVTGANPSAIAYNSATGEMWVCNYGANTVQRFNGSGVSQGTTPTGTQPYAIAYNSATGEMWVCNYGANTVQRFNASGVSQGTTVTGSNPNSIAYHSLTGEMWVCNVFSYTLQRYNSSGASQGVTSTIALIFGLAYNPISIEMWACGYGNNTVGRYSSSSLLSVTVTTTSGSGVFNKWAITSPAFWLDLGDTNKWQMFNTKPTLQTSNSLEIRSVFRANNRNGAVALMSLSCTQVRFTMSRVGAVFVGSIAGTTLTVASVTSGVLSVGDTIYGTGVTQAPDAPYLGQGTVITALEQITTGGNPQDVAYNTATGEMWVCNQVSNTVQRYSSLGVLLSTTATSLIPFAMAYNTATGEMWVCNQSSNTVQRYNAVGTSLGATATGTSPRAIAYNTATGEMWVCNQGSSTVERYNAAGVSLGTTATGASPISIAYNTATGEMWVCNFGANTVQRYNSAGTSLGTTATGTNPRGIAYNTATGEMWACNSGSATVQRYNASGTSLGTTATGTTPLAIAYNTATGEMWVCNQASNTVQRYNAAGVSLGTTATGSTPSNIAYNTAANQMWLCNLISGSLQRYSSAGVSIQYTVSRSQTTPAAGTQTMACGAEVYHSLKGAIINGTGNGWYGYFFGDKNRVTEMVELAMPLFADTFISVTLTDPVNAKCGALVIGSQSDLGETQYGAEVGIQDYSLITTDDFGNRSILERAYNKRGKFKITLAGAEVDNVQNRLAAYRATPVVYIGADQYKSTIIYGLFKNMSTVIAYPNYSILDVEIQG